MLCGSFGRRGVVSGTKMKRECVCGERKKKKYQTLAWFKLVSFLGIGDFSAKFMFQRELRNFQNETAELTCFAPTPFCVSELSEPFFNTTKRKKKNERILRTRTRISLFV
jgi:hypothetical protein